MGYCTITDIKNVISQALTNFTPTDDVGPIDLLKIGNEFDTNLIPSDIVNWYISQSGSEIDGMLSALYMVPFVETVDLETTLYSPIDEYNIRNIVLKKPLPLCKDDEIILFDGDVEERHIIDEEISPTVFQTVEDIIFAFSSGTRIVRVSYPKPLKVIAARWAAANIYDKYFSSQNSPDVSNFGKYLRKLARSDLNNILKGITVLHGAKWMGRRFSNSYLHEQYRLPFGGEGDRQLDQAE